MVNDADTFKGTNTPILENKKKKKQQFFSEIVAIQLKNGIYTASTAIKDHQPCTKSGAFSRLIPHRFARKPLYTKFKSDMAKVT